MAEPRLVTRKQIVRGVTDGLVAWYCPPQPSGLEYRLEQARARVMAEWIATDVTGEDDEAATGLAVEEWIAAMAATVEGRRGLY